MDITEVPARLATLAEAKSLSVFSRQAKLPLRTLQRIATGEANPTLSTLMLIAAALTAYNERLAREIVTLGAELAGLNSASSAGA